MKWVLLLSVEQLGMGESVPAIEFDFPKTIKIELSDKALKLLVPEELGDDFVFHSLDVKNINTGFG